MVKRKSDGSADLEPLAQGSSSRDVFAQQRAENIARNRAKMQALGLLNVASPAVLRPSEPAPAQAPAKRRRTTQAEVLPCQALALSRHHPYFGAQVSVCAGLHSNKGIQTSSRGSPRCGLPTA